MTKHTPGPWHRAAFPRSQAFVVTRTPGDVYGDIANVLAGLGARDPEIEANARLIAAAPELLDALKQLVMATKHLNPCPGTLEMAEDAIKAAEGEV